jgi:hypothetical protein
MDVLQSLPFSLCESGSEQVDGVGNYALKILAPYPSQVPVSTIYLLDSHGQIPSEVHNPDYDPIKASQIEWFTNASKAHRESFELTDHGDCTFLSLAFFHIPLPEFGDPQLNICGGDRREPTEGPSMNTHFFNALTAAGILAVGCGHDHVNDFCARVLQNTNGENSEIGPWLCYGGSCGFGGYCSYGRERFHRRMRVWELNAKNGSLKTWKRVEYAESRVDEVLLVEKGVILGTRHEMNTFQ